MIPKNILSGFRFAGNWPCDPNIFTQLDFAPLNVTDRAMFQEDSEGQQKEAAILCFPSRWMVSDAMDMQNGAPSSDIGTDNPLEESPSLIAGRIAVTPQENLSPIDQPSISYISPSDILSIPKAPPRKQKQNAR